MKRIVRIDCPHCDEIDEFHCAVGEDSSDIGPCQMCNKVYGASIRWEPVVTVYTLKRVD